MMSDTPSKSPTVSLFGRDIQRSTVERARDTALYSLLIINALFIPFVIPKARRSLGAPFFPTNSTKFGRMLETLQLRSSSPKLLDIGSGMKIHMVQYIYIATYRGRATSC